MDIIDSFKKIQKLYSASLKIESSKWYNGHAYFPLTRFLLLVELENCRININYEFRESEFSNSSTIHGGAYKDRHLCSIKSYCNNINIPRFSISERGIFNRIFKKDGTRNYTVNCKELEFKNILYEMNDLKELYKIVEDSSEFRPLIRGRIQNENQYIEIEYNTASFNYYVIVFFITLCNKISSYKENLL